MKTFLFNTLLFIFLNFVLAESYQSVKGFGVDTSKNKALILAKRDVISKTIGVLISTKQVIKNYMEVSSKIISSTNGYISKFDIISQTKDKDNNWTIEICADVTDVIDDILLKKANLKLLIVEMGLPSFSLKPTLKEKSNTLIETLILKSLLNYGFKIQDSSNTDYVLEYNSIIDSKSMENLYNIKAIKSVSFSLDCKLIKKNDNSIIFTSNTNSTAAHISEKAALRQAIEKSIPLLGKDIVKGIFKHGITSNQIDLKEVKVIIKDLPYKEMFKLQKVLNKKFRTNEFVFDKGYKNGKQIFIIKSFYSSNEISKFFLLSKECNNFSFILEMKNDDKIILRLE